MIFVANELRLSKLFWTKLWVLPATDRPCFASSNSAIRLHRGWLRRGWHVKATDQVPLITSWQSDALSRQVRRQLSTFYGIAIFFCIVGPHSVAI